LHKWNEKSRNIWDSALIGSLIINKLIGNVNSMYSRSDIFASTEFMIIAHFWLHSSYRKGGTCQRQKQI